VDRCQQPQLAALPVREAGLHLRALDVEPRFREVEVRCHRLQQPAVLVARERERVRLVLPGQPGRVEQLALGIVREARLRFSPEIPELHTGGLAGETPVKRPRSKRAALIHGVWG
jgi:hypothetical protein